MTKKRIVKTGTERLLASMRQHWTQPLAGKCVFDAEQLASIETMAKELGIQPITEDVPEPKTDGELMLQATENCSGHVFLTSEADDIAAEFLRLRAERDGVPCDHADPDNTGCCIKCQLETEKWLDDDGEPLEVTRETIADWYMEWRADQDTPRQSEWFAFLAAKINAHRGVRPVPKVTPEMLNEALKLDAGLWHITAYLNDKLAKQAGKAGG